MPRLIRSRCNINLSLCLCLPLRPFPKSLRAWPGSIWYCQLASCFIVTLLPYRAYIGCLCIPTVSAASSRKQLPYKNPHKKTISPKARIFWASVQPRLPNIRGTRLRVSVLGGSRSGVLRFSDLLRALGIGVCREFQTDPQAAHAFMLQRCDKAVSTRALGVCRQSDISRSSRDPSKL